MLRDSFVQSRVTGSDEMIEGSDPFALFDEWFTLATTTEVNDANAMALATTGADGLPDVRIVLLKSADDSGFTFYTNTQSQKGSELSQNMRAAGVFHWKSLRRQVRFRGLADFVSSDEADAYFASRMRGSRVGAWASAQSRILTSRSELEQAVAREEDRFAGSDIPRPPHWTGYRVQPTYIEFWLEKSFRLHDRLVFRRNGPGEEWRSEKLYP